MTEVIEPYKNYSSEIYTLETPNKFSMAGVDYNTGYVLGGRNSSYLLFNLNGEYTEIKGTLGMV